MGRVRTIKSSSDFGFRTEPYVYTASQISVTCWQLAFTILEPWLNKQELQLKSFISRSIIFTLPCAPAGSFSGGQITNAGSGYVSGGICLLGNSSGGFGFHGTFDVDPYNGSIVSFSIVEHGVNYVHDPAVIGLCFPSSNDLQVSCCC